ncbi:MAG: efflux RND transporter periplasmic adaptor subunit [candidate division Zixibacteria bacterium]|nr:efflux RND transporter periplasmic adaptor subunit [candidate division Zixibacteria bacterium]
MDNNTEKRPFWHAFVPGSRRMLLLVVVVAAAAFFLGRLASHSDESSRAVSANGSTTQTSPESAVWTCSMHPQIQLPKPGKCPICFMDLIPVDAGGDGDTDPGRIRMSETAVKLADIRTTPAVHSAAERTVRMPGKLTYDETRVAYITAWVPGRLDRLLIDFTGATVEKHEPMVEMYSPELIAAQEELLQARTAVHSLDQSRSSVLKSTAEATLASAREKLRLFGLTDKQISDLEDAGSVPERLIIRAPAAGVVIQKEAREGMYVTTGTRIYTIADLSTLWVTFEAYESDLPWLKKGQQVAFESPSFPGETFNAEIDFIDPVVDPKSRTVDVRAVVPNDRGRLKPDMLVTGIVRTSITAGAATSVAGFAPGVNQPGADAPLLIPSTAPLITGKRAIVYVRVPSDDGVVFEGREITLGPRAGDFYIVRSGLHEGDRVVTNGAFKIDSEMQIQARRSMMSPPENDSAPMRDHIHDSSHASRTASRPKPYRAGDAPRLTTSGEALEALSPLYDAYFEVQMALANDDLSSATVTFDSLGAAVDAIQANIFRGEPHSRWTILSRRLADASQAGAAAGDIAAARDAFYHASLAVIELHDTFGHAGESPFYLTFCPMARDNAGAYWLQEENIVWNSFYGDMMLRCGEIKSELPGQAVTE